MDDKINMDEVRDEMWNVIYKADRGEEPEADVDAKLCSDYWKGIVQDGLGNEEEEGWCISNDVFVAIAKVIEEIAPSIDDYNTGDGQVFYILNSILGASKDPDMLGAMAGMVAMLYAMAVEAMREFQVEEMIDELDI